MESIIAIIIILVIGKLIFGDSSSENTSDSRCPNCGAKGGPWGSVNYYDSDETYATRKGYSKWCSKCNYEW